MQINGTQDTAERRLALPAPREDAGSLFANVAAILGARPYDREGAPHIDRFRFGEGELEFYFATGWQDTKKGRISATLPRSWSGSTSHNGAPGIGFSLNRSPEAIAQDIRRRWLVAANAWHWQRAAEKRKADCRQAEEQFRVEALMKANGCGFTYAEAKRHGDTFAGHRISFQAYDLSPDSYHGFRVQLEVRSGAALRMIAVIAGEDYRLHCEKH